MRIAYDPDLSRVGQVVEVDEMEARRLIREGRAARVDQSQDEPTPATAGGGGEAGRKAAVRDRPEVRAFGMPTDQAPAAPAEPGT